MDGEWIYLIGPDRFEFTEQPTEEQLKERLGNRVPQWNKEDFPLKDLEIDTKYQIRVSGPVKIKKWEEVKEFDTTAPDFVTQVREWSGLQTVEFIDPNGNYINWRMMDGRKCVGADSELDRMSGHNPGRRVRAGSTTNGGPTREDV
jgi:hypothetical protein